MSSGCRALVALGAGLIQGCATANLGEYCRGTELANADTASLAVVMGAPADSFSASPFIAFHTPSRAEPTASLLLHLKPAATSWPTGLDETPCRGLDWRTFTVEVEPDQWTQFWTLPRPLQLETAIGFADTLSSLRTSRFGVALIDGSTGKTLLSCGCYWT